MAIYSIAKRQIDLFSTVNNSVADSGMSCVPVDSGDSDSDAYECAAPTDYECVPDISDVPGAPMITGEQLITITPATFVASGVNSVNGMSGMTKKSHVHTASNDKPVCTHKRSGSHPKWSSRARSNSNLRSRSR